MAGKIALITGSTSGIGLGIAKKLAHEGYQIILNGFGEPPLVERLLGEIKDLSSYLPYYYDTDLTHPPAIEKMIADINHRIGPIDILVNNAGLQFVAPLTEFPPEKWDLILALDLSAVFHTSRLALPAMCKKKWGRVINIASAHAVVASPFKSAYVAAKHGVAGLTKVAALEVAQHGVTVNAISPGYVHTPLVDGQIESTAKARGITREQVINDVMLGNQATKKFVTIEEVADFVAFLCTPGAASITGAILSIDGGWTAH